MKIVGVTLGWNGNPQLAYRRDDKRGIFVLPYDYELKTKPEYYPDGPNSWPKNPKTGEKLEIVE